MGDGRGTFVPLNTEADDCDETSDDNNSFANSSLSQDSALSLEYGDEHLNDEYGEITDRLTDSRLEVAAQAYFSKEEKQTKIKNEISSLKRAKRSRRYRGSQSSRRRGRNWSSKKSEGRSVRSQTSSILSSESESVSSFKSSDDDEDECSLEMESAMMDLQLIEKRGIR